ncbi:hypothetical protein JCM3774_001726 [Rhodotorula dairenensis]
MKLTLVPPNAYPVPQALYSHELHPPSFRPRRANKVPEAWQRTRKTLAGADLRLPDPLAADSTAWWLFSVEEVEWNLELDEVTVSFVGGDRETWDLSPQSYPRSSPMVIDSDMEDAPGSPDSAAPSPPTAGTDDCPSTSRWHPNAVSARLRDFAVELRGAYEDLGTAAASDPSSPDISSENDFRLLMLLAAEPSREVPFEWSDAQTMYEYAMMGVDEDGAGTTSESPAPGEGAWTGRNELRRPSQGRRLDLIDVAESDPYKYTGQFSSRRRKAATKGRSGSAAKSYDYLSVIDLLSRIRTYLCELFPATIVPNLRERLPPTYTLWAADCAIVWCRREAISKARVAADLMVELLDDDGDTFDCTDKSSRSSQGGIVHDIRVDDTEEHFDLLSGSTGPDDWQAEEQRHERLADNPLRLLRDDYELRRWCVDASERARLLELGDDGTSFVASPDWLRPVPPVDIALALGDDSSDSEPSRRTRKRLRLSEVAPSSSPPSSAPSCNIASGESPPRISLSDSDTETSDFDELSDDGIPVDGIRHLADDFFYPPDPLGESLLPRRLPKELAERNSQRGPELEEHREQLYRTLNQIAGLQNRLVELHELVKRETQAWEGIQEEKAKEKTSWAPTVTGSALKGRRTLPKPPPSGLRRRQPKINPPLLKQTGDRALERSLDKARRSADLPTLPDRSKDSNASISRSLGIPRKRQRQNLETYSKLAAKSTYIRSDADEDQAGEEWQGPRAKRKRSTGAKEPARKKQKRKHTGSAVLGTRPKRPALACGTRLETGGTDPSSEATPSRAALHTPVLGVGEQRRQVLQALTSGTGLGDSSLGVTCSQKSLEAEIDADVDVDVDLGGTMDEEGVDDIKGASAGEADDDLDELEQVEIQVGEPASEGDPASHAPVASTLLAPADSPVVDTDHGSNDDVLLGAPTPLPSRSGGIPGSTGTLSPIKPIAQPSLDPTRFAVSPAYPVSAERSHQQQQQGGKRIELPRPPTNGTPSLPVPPSTLFLGQTSWNGSDIDTVADPWGQQFGAPFAVPCARLTNLSPPFEPLELASPTHPTRASGDSRRSGDAASAAWQPGYRAE